jgi:hypothetical protein
VSTAGVIFKLEGLDQLKKPMTSSEKEPVTFRLVASCPNQLRYRVPLITIIIIIVIINIISIILKYPVDELLICIIQIIANLDLPKNCP